MGIQENGKCLFMGKKNLKNIKSMEKERIAYKPKRNIS